MSRHDETVVLRHMLDHAREAVALAQGRTRTDLDTDRTLELSLTRLVEIVGEAASRAPEDLRRRHADIPWRDIVSMRNRLIHGYDKVDRDILWNVVAGDLPPLVARIEKILGP